jgi:Holliday junction resolvasome RuvABC endonuclease subunit
VSTPRLVAAIDPGLAHVGLGLVARYGSKLDLVDSKHIATEPRGNLDSADAKRIDLTRRLREIWHGLALFCREYRPSILGIEDQAPAAVGARMRGLKAAADGEKSGGFNSNNDPVFEVVGIAKAVAFSYGIPVLLYVPEHAKIAVCGPGKGKATKREVITACRIYFPGIERDGHRLGEHEADAIAGAIYVERVTLLQSRRAG